MTKFHERQNSGPRKISVDVFQLGAREHYAVPEMLYEVGLLRYLHTDVYSGPGSFLHPLFLPNSISSRLRFFRSISERNSTLPSGYVKPNNIPGFFFEALLKFNNDVYRETLIRHQHQKVMACSALMQMRVKPDVIVGFRGSEVLFESLRDSSCCILDQIDGGMPEVDLIREEQERFPDWRQERRQSISRRSWLDIERPRLQREFAAAQAIVCNSQWSRNCLIRSGVASEKCHVIPLAFKSQIYPPYESVSRMNYRRGALTIGFLGTVTLRKGIHYLLEAARHAKLYVDIRVLIAGPLDIPSERLHDYRDIAVYVGRIPRGDVSAFLGKVDVLALPSISEGFGIVQLEAMSHGIPVLTTDRVGDVVRDGIDGVLVPTGDIHAISQALVMLARDPLLRARMSEHAVNRVQDFSPDRVGNLWQRTIHSVFSEWCKKMAEHKLG